MDPVYKKVERCYQSIQGNLPFVPYLALVLGSGLGDLADGYPCEGAIEYQDIGGLSGIDGPGP